MPAKGLRGYTFIEGDPEKPAVIFIHGLGMSGDFWTDPLNCRILSGLFRMRLLIRNGNDDRTLFHDLMDAGHTVATWSQSRPIGPIEDAVAELHALITGLPPKSVKKGIILVCHSRGGLIARSWLIEKYARPDTALPEIRGLATLASPHAGTEMARWSVHVKGIAAFINGRLKNDAKTEAGKAARRILSFLESKAVEDLLPESELIASLQKENTKDAARISLGGTNPTLVEIPGVFSIPGTLEKILGANLLPEELRTGLGDSLVTARSAMLPHADFHADFPVNHVGIAVDPDARAEILRRIREM